MKTATHTHESIETHFVVNAHDWHVGESVYLIDSEEVGRVTEVLPDGRAKVEVVQGEHG